MYPLRQTRRFARHVLAWFVLSLGLSFAQPLLAQPLVELVCSSGGVMKMVTPDAGDRAAHQHQDCSVCMSVAMPPAMSLGAPVLPFTPCLLSLAIDISRAAADAAPPLPARGPPALIRA